MKTEHRYELLKQLLPLLDAYPDDVPPPSPAAFARWVAAGASSDGPPPEGTSPEGAPAADTHGNAPPPDGPDQMDDQLSYALLTLYKHAKGYIKRALRETDLASADDWTYLATLMQRGDLTKSELIRRNLQEVPSGTVVINRLLKHGFITSFEDPDDKRARRLRITPSGQEAFVRALPDLQVVSTLVAGRLAPAEKETLRDLLFRLMDFHAPIFTHDGRTDLSIVRAKYLPDGTV
ncbi:MAG: MarR family winged helix-turn-helix transcriptional regulator [Catalinimonas sp.]